MKKFLFIFALVVSLVLAGTGSVVYAMDYPSNLPDFPSLPYAPEDSYHIIYLNSDSVYYLLVIEAPDKESVQVKYVDDYLTSIYVGSLSTLREFKLVNNSWQHVTNTSLERKWTNHGMSVNHQGYVYSDIDIYDSEGNIFFPVPPGPLGMPEGILTQILTQENPLMEILKLLPMAIPCLVGFVALRKALRTLETILKTA